MQIKNENGVNDETVKDDQGNIYNDIEEKKESQNL